jgi:glycosyltransferase involved in cell wall biosynthesis
VFEAYGKLSLRAVLGIRKFIKKNRIDVLHTHWYKPDIIGLMAAAGTNCRVVSTPHGWSKNADFKLHCYEGINRLIFPFFSAVVPVSREIYQELNHLPWLGHKLHLIENGVDLEEIGTVTEINDAIASWRHQGRFVLGYIGQLIPRKGLDILIQAFASLDYRSFRLAIVGSGAQEAELRNLVDRYSLGEYIKFFGFREDRLGFLKGFDAFILPSRREGTPRCVMEAMAAGVPVIVSNIQGCLNLVTHNNNGLVFEVDDHQNLANQINRLRYDTSLRARLCREAQRHILKQFSAQRMADEYLQLYESLCALSPRDTRPLLD